jgi:hypothetical protein
METPVAYVVQTAFAGLADDQVAGDIPERCRVLAAEDPDIRGDYGWAHLRYMARFHGLDEALHSGQIRSVEDLRCWMKANRVPSFRTVANRLQELFRANAELRPPPEIMQRRQKQRTQGRIK